MRSLFAIASQTMRAALRSHVVHVVLVLLGLAVVLLPLTIADDGTAQGHMQVSLNYSLSVVGILLSLVALWLGCTTMADEVETYQIHMVVSKPVSRARIWWGKWLGIVILQGLLLTVAAVAVYGLTLWRLSHAKFSQEEQARLQSEVMVSRRIYSPRLPEYEKMAAAELERRLAGGAVMPGQMAERQTLDSLVRQMKKALDEVPVGATRLWRFEQLPVVPREGFLSLRFRMYIDSVKTREQRPTKGVWVIFDPEVKQPLGVMPYNAMTGTFQELLLPAAVVADNKLLVVGFQNLDPEGKSVVFQPQDGPSILLPEGGFGGNYARVVLLIFFQIAFLAALGCTCGAAVSAPVAIFLALSYVVVGTVVDSLSFLWIYDPVVWPPGLLAKTTAAFSWFLDQLQTQGDVVQQFAWFVRGLVQLVVVSINQFNEVGRLAHGELVGLGALLSVFIQVIVLRGGPVAALGIWALTRRELGRVIRR
jgi:hypothetical protein